MYLHSTVVGESSAGLNHLQLLLHSTTDLATCMCHTIVQSGLEHWTTPNSAPYTQCSLNVWCSRSKWFNQVWMYSTTPNSCLFILYPYSFCGAVVGRGLAVLNYPELMFTNTPCSLCQTVVQKHWNYAELMFVLLMVTHLTSCVKQWFDQVWKLCSVWLNHSELMLNFPTHLVPNELLHHKKEHGI